MFFFFPNHWWWWDFSHCLFRQKQYLRELYGARCGRGASTALSKICHLSEEAAKLVGIGEILAKNSINTDWSKGQWFKSKKRRTRLFQDRSIFMSFFTRDVCSDRLRTSTNSAFYACCLCEKKSRWSDHVSVSHSTGTSRWLRTAWIIFTFLSPHIVLTLRFASSISYGFRNLSEQITGSESAFGAIRVNKSWWMRACLFLGLETSSAIELYWL